MYVYYYLTIALQGIVMSVMFYREFLQAVVVITICSVEKP